MKLDPAPTDQAREAAEFVAQKLRVAARADGEDAHFVELHSDFLDGLADRLAAPHEWHMVSDEEARAERNALSVEKETFPVPTDQGAEPPTNNEITRHKVTTTEGLVRVERDFLVLWLGAGRGMSATELVAYALTGDEPDAAPADNDDLNRCRIAYDLAPPHLQERMKPILDGWEAAIASRALADEGETGDD